MRLGQLARKISIRQADMIDFLAKSGVAIGNESNTRLEDEHVQSILQHFAPSFLDEKIEEAESILPEVTPQDIIIPFVQSDEIEGVQEIVIPKVETPLIEEKTEVIKAPKVDLPGLKVIGKIELPEAKKKEVLPTEESERIEVPLTDSKPNIKPQTQRSPRNVQDNNRRERTSRSAVNPIALQREREAQAAEEKRKADAVREKEKRTEYYLNRVKASAPTKPARIYSESVEQYTATTKKEEPKTLLGKFLRWLTT